MRVSRQNMNISDRVENTREKTADINMKEEYANRLAKIEKLQSNVAQ